MINICHEALDRHLGTPTAEKTALRWVAKTWPTEGSIHEIHYKDLAQSSCRFAHVLEHLQVQKGDRVFALLPRIPELFTVCFGTLRIGSVFSPLFSAFGSEPLLTRMKIGETQVLVALASYNENKIAPAIWSSEKNPCSAPEKRIK